MSEVVVRMEMPRNCDECEVNYDCAFCGITGSAFYGNNRAPNFMPDEQKLPDCPIIGVLPEHGDLIDRDELKKHKRHSEKFCENIVSVAQIDWMPIIVPATERSET